MSGNLANSGLQLAGGISLIIFLGHTPFYRILRWKRDLAGISPLNARILMPIHIATTILLFSPGVLTIRYSSQLSQPTEIASAICFTLSLFWGWRLNWQIIYFKPSKIPHDNKLLFLHYSLIVMFSVLVIAYAAPLIARPQEESSNGKRVLPKMSIKAL
jgi:hypothetical protein